MPIRVVGDGCNGYIVVERSSSRKQPYGWQSTGRQQPVPAGLDASLSV